MKTIESKIAPNPKEAQIWVDLSADAHGNIRKIWSGKKWVANDSNAEVIKVMSTTISNLETKLNSVITQFNTQIVKLSNAINTLNNKVAQLEKELAQ